MSGSLFDTNVWLAAVFKKHDFHGIARKALEQSSATNPAVFCRSTQQSFLRLASTRALLKTYDADGMSNRDAIVAYEQLQAQPHVTMREEPTGLQALWLQLAGLDTASPKVWMDAYLAAFAIRGKLRLVTLDQDFKNFVSQGLHLSLLAP